MLEGLEKLERFERRLDRLLGPDEPTPKLAPSTERRDAAKQLIARWRDDPALYCWERLGFRLHDKQIEIALAVPQYTHVSVHSGHKTGKSRGIVGIGPWWGETREYANVIFTSSTDDQVKLILWQELRVVLQQLTQRERLDAPDWVLDGLALLPFGELPKDPRIGVALPLSGNLLMGRVAGSTEGTAGFSGANILIIPDEASGIDESFFAAFEGNSAGGGRQLLFGNPTQTSGTFFDTGKPGNWVENGGVWKFFRLPSNETINALEGRIVIPGLATREWCEQRLREWGPDDPRYQVRVLGRPPTQASNSVIALGDVERAIARYASAKPDGPLCIGVDVARFGDDQSVAAPVRGSLSYPRSRRSGYDSIQVAEMVLDLVVREKRPDERCTVIVDVGGGYGGGVVDQLVRLISAHERPDINMVEVVSFNGAEAATDESYVNCRDQSWFAMGDWLKTTGAIPRDDKLEGDLLAPQFQFDAKARRKVEPKKDIKKRLKRSPDDGDALAIALWGRASGESSWVLDPEDNDLS
jgi:hypothetical protein